MCDVPSTAVFCSESIECFPGIASRFFLKLFVTILVAPIITGFHIRCTSVPNSCILTSFPLPIARHFLSAGIATSISVRVSPFLFLIIISGLFAVNSLSIIIIIIIIIYLICVRTSAGFVAGPYAVESRRKYTGS
jgi:hypothetical protein